MNLEALDSVAAGFMGSSLSVGALNKAGSFIPSGSPGRPSMLYPNKTVRNKQGEILFELTIFNKKLFKAYMYLWKVLVLDTQYFLSVKSENSPTGCSDNAALLLWQCRLLGIQEMSIPVITTRDYGTH